MSGRWYYRVFDQEIGPVEWGTLQAMAAEQQLSPEDQVRRETETEWTAAGAVSGLFPEAPSPDELDSMLAEADPTLEPAVEIDIDNEAVASEADLAAMLATEETRNASPQSKSSRGCYYRTRTEEIGPIEFDQLVELARGGMLGARDQVRIGSRGEWVEARSIVGLFADPSDRPAARDSDTPDTDSSLLEEFEIVPETPLPAATKAEPPVVEDPERCWYCRLLGQEIGPVRIEDVRALIESGQLGPTDAVRQGRDSKWRAARSIPGLIPRARRKSKRLSDEDVLGFLQPSESSSPTPAHVAPQRLSGSRPPASRRDVSAAFRPSARSDSSEQAAEAPASTSESPARPAAAVPPPATPPRPVAVPQSRPRRGIGNPLSGMGGALAGAFGALSPRGIDAGALTAHWKAIAAVVVLLAVGAVMYAGLPVLPFGNSGNKYFVETEVIWRQAVLLQKTGTEQDWQTFCTKTKPRVDELAAELGQIAGSHNRLLQLMLFCHRDCLPRILAGSPQDNKETWTEMKRYMEEAAFLAAQ